VNPVSTGLNLLAWIFLRLPLGFSLPFTGMSLWWIFGGFRLLNDAVATPATDAVGSALASMLPKPIGNTIVSDFSAFVHAAAVIALFAVGFVLAYNISALVNWVILALRIKRSPYAAGPPQSVSMTPGPDVKSPFDGVRRIGIVLAGGGAKGAYQAGAMKAIYEFLALHNALTKVAVISGTSIGSWNALFWLGRLIKPPGDWSGVSIHESWWRSISAKSLTAPSWYVPLLRNAFLSSAPWQQCFDQIFGRDDVKRQLMASSVHFYFTRSDVRSGTLECATNNPVPPEAPRVRYEYVDPSGDSGTFLEGVKAGVFASMDLPPLFPFAERAGRLFEDGGVIDNLPIMFPAMEGCDLIFILPLNANFEERPNTHSILARFLRVMDVRQGALERGGFKLLYLYNELAALRQRASAAMSPDEEAEVAPGPLEVALRRRNELINVFAICPLKSFVESNLNTVELWKRKEAALAFSVMYDAASKLLPAFKFEQQDAVRVALVGRTADVTWDEHF
jgi:NTE family protein